MDFNCTILCYIISVMHCVFTTQKSNCFPSPHICPFTASLDPFPAVNQHGAVCVYESLIFVCVLCCFGFISHSWVKSHSSLTYSAWFIWLSMLFTNPSGYLLKTFQNTLTSFLKILVNTFILTSVYSGSN